MKVLVVDDSQSIRLLMEHYLTKHGYEVFFAVNGSEGLDAARVHKPDFIISDILMPGVDGFDFLKALRGDNEIRHIPFIFFSGSDIDDETINIANSLGADGFIEKTNDFRYIIQDLNTVIKKITKRRSKEQGCT